VLKATGATPRVGAHEIRLPEDFRSTDPSATTLHGSANPTLSSRAKPRDLLCALTPDKGHLCFATARRVSCLGRTNRLVKTCELARGAFVWCQGAQQVPRLPPDFLSGVVSLVNCMRLSLKKAAYVAVDESSVVGNPEYARDDKWRVVTFIRGCQIGWTEKQQQVPRLRS
jgi:hypothetical protein